MDLKGASAFFDINDYEDYATASSHHEDKIRVSGVVWFTNLDFKERHEDLLMYKKYYGNEEKFPKYDNYDAINVDKTKEMPEDYFGEIGVPLTFLDKWNPDQFEIIGQMANSNVGEFNLGYPYVDGTKKYAKIIIKRKI